MSSHSAAPRWSDIWKLFDASEQQDACLCLLATFREQPDSPVARRIIRRLAEGTGSRPQQLCVQALSAPSKVAASIRARAAALLDHESWVALLSEYYLRRKSALLCAFLDGLGIAHDARGAASADIEEPPPDRVSSVVESLLRIYSVREIARYLAVVEVHAPGWRFVAQHRERLLNQLDEESQRDAGAAPAQAETTAAASPEFGVLDRVLIDQVVRAAMQIEGSLDAAQVEDLIEQTIRLNERWYRGFFHLGFMDVLLPARPLRFDHPGDNQARRTWYLAGVLSGLIRSNDTDGLRKVLAERGSELQAALSDARGAGASIARTGWRKFMEIGALAEAAAAIRGQGSRLGLAFCRDALESAASLIRQGQFDPASVLIQELRRVTFLPDEDVGEIAHFQLGLSRRHGQCLQARGDFEGAEREFRRLIEKDDRRTPPELIADLGLVKGRFRSIFEVRLPDDNAARIGMREAITRGEDYFKRASSRSDGATPKAVYPLAVLAYLRWCYASSREKEPHRERAAALASSAVSAILGSEFSSAYHQNGALGQAQFMLAVTRLNSLDDVQGREAHAAWQTITAEAGRFPKDDMQRLLEALPVYGPDVADPIAESILDFRPDDALDLLIGGPWMKRSARLRAALAASAQNPAVPRADRIRLWTSAIPLLKGANELAAAADGLDQLELLAELPEEISSVHEFLSHPPNYDPVWSAVEAGHARARLLRKLGRDSEIVQELARLFYLVRDSRPWEAQQIVDLLEEWQLDPGLRAELVRAMPIRTNANVATVAERLLNGEIVDIVFIGGNEVQAQYDEHIRREIHSKWPGVSVQFEHTGWSSNWGRELTRLLDRANAADAVVLMSMMRTMLGRGIREGLRKPWISCNSTGRTGTVRSLQHAAVLAVELRLGLR